ncbi:uncharacterized protein [Kogia breviceps]|uniref:uncharacterized protein n=1 Tax=Kogia breviceps TaxID=27615 RepID=UPI0034D2B6A0
MGIWQAWIEFNPTELEAEFFPHDLSEHQTASQALRTQNLGFPSFRNSRAYVVTQHPEVPEKKGKLHQREPRFSAPRNSECPCAEGRRAEEPKRTPACGDWSAGGGGNPYLIGSNSGSNRKHSLVGFSCRSNTLTVYLICIALNFHLFWVSWNPVHMDTQNSTCELGGRQALKVSYRNKVSGLRNNRKNCTWKRIIWTGQTSAQELASQDEKLLLMESSLKATQEQLTEQIAETVRQEQNSRKPQAELKTVTEGIIASEEEKNDDKMLRAE